MTACRVLLLLSALTAVLSLPQGWWPAQLTLPPPDLPSVEPRPTPPPPPPPPTQAPTFPPSTPPPPPTQAPAFPPSTAPPQQQQSTTPACDCPTPPQYNPVCGSNNQTYTNPQKLECARTCGQQVTILYLGTCQLRRR